jgi:hypothetical protein
MGDVVSKFARNPSTSGRGQRVRRHGTERNLYLYTNGNRTLITIAPAGDEWKIASVYPILVVDATGNFNIGQGSAIYKVSANGIVKLVAGNKAGRGIQS